MKKFVASNAVLKEYISEENLEHIEISGQLTKTTLAWFYSNEPQISAADGQTVSTSNASKTDKQSKDIKIEVVILSDESVNLPSLTNDETSTVNTFYISSQHTIDFA